MIDTIIAFYNEECSNIEDFLNIGFDVIEFGEDFDEFERHQESRAIIHHTASDKYYAITIRRSSCMWGYNYDSVSKEDVYEVEPKEVTVIQYFKK